MQYPTLANKGIRTKLWTPDPYCKPAKPPINARPFVYIHTEQIRNLFMHIHLKWTFNTSRNSGLGSRRTCSFHDLTFISYSWRSYILHVVKFQFISQEGLLFKNKRLNAEQMHANRYNQPPNCFRIWYPSGCLKYIELSGDGNDILKHTL